MLIDAHVNDRRPRRDSNTRPFAPQANALSTELRGRMPIFIGYKILMDNCSLVKLPILSAA